MMFNSDVWPHRRAVNLSRFFLATRSPIPLPDGFSYSGTLQAMGTGHSSDDVNWVNLLVHQVPGGPGQSLRAADALMRVFGRPKAPSSNPGLKSPDLDETWSVVEIITPDEVTSSPAPDAPPHTRGWDEDPIMRTIHALRQLVRAERISSEGISALPTYEHVMNPILAQRGTGEQLMEGKGTDSRVLATEHPDEWGELNLVMLEHNNFAMDGIRIRAEAGSTDPVLMNWLVALELKLPGALWRERLQDARQQLWVEGRYDLAVILFATATEVLLDGLLQMLWWEKSLTDSHTTAASVAHHFDRTRDSLDRMNRFLVPLLGGNWSRTDGPVQVWKRQTYKLRHLCAHGGYFPSTVEAAAASDSSDEVATFLFDRLGDKRTEFPRTCIMTLAQSGLERRNQWDARIQRFTENEAKQEPNWNLSLQSFRDEVESLRQR